MLKRIREIELEMEAIREKGERIFKSDDGDDEWNPGLEHAKADKLLCELLRSMGYESLVDDFENIH